MRDSLHIFDTNLSLSLKKSFSSIPSPTVLANKHYLKLRKENIELIFNITIKTEADKKYSIFTLFNSTVGEYLTIDIKEGNVNIKQFKTFILDKIISLSNNGYSFKQIYIPKRAMSENMLKFFNLCHPTTKITPFLKKDIQDLNKQYTFYNKIIDDKENGIDDIRENITVILENQPKTQINKLNIKNKNIRNFSTSAINTQENSIKDKQGWITYTSNIKNDFIDENVINRDVDSFINYYRQNHNEDKNFSLQIVLQLSDNQLRNLGSSQITNINEINIVLNSIIKLITLKDWHGPLSSMNYLENEKPFGTLLFKFRPSNSPSTIYHTFSLPELNVIENLEQSTLQKNTSIVDGKSFNGFPLPPTMDLDYWKGIKYSKDSKYGEFQYIMKDNSEKSYNVKGMVTIHEDSSNVRLFRSLNGEIVELFSYTDTLQNGANLDSFKREITSTSGKTYTYIYQDSKLKFYLKPEFVTFIKPINKDKEFNTKNIATMDIETRQLNSGLLEPKIISFYINKKKQSFFIENLEEDILKTFQSLLKSTNNNKKIYVHNLSGFDGIFILDTLSKLGKVDFLLRKGKIIKLSLKFKIKENGPSYKINFVDSLLLLPSSLDSLGKAFQIEDMKKHFPLKFLNKPNFNMDYEGEVPPYTDFYDHDTDKFTIKDYEEYKLKFVNKKWICKDELRLYCEQDCLALFQILEKFGNYVFKEFNINITKSVTTSSLSLRIYLANFIVPDTIPHITSTKLHKTLHHGFLGGICESYKAYGEDLNSYDVNSLYPYVMKNFPMTTGTPVYLEGNPFDYDPNAFGFFYCRVTAPDIDKPILPKRIQTSGGIRTALPIGTWEGLYFSEEIKNAINYGYKITCTGGYLFKKGYIFEDFIEKLYNIKQSHEPNHPMYYIAKLIMNSLYGRFGLGPIDTAHKIISSDQVDDFIKNNDSPELTVLPSGNCIASFKLPESETMNLNSCVPISAAISSYGRIVMSHLLVKYSDQIYSIDTDGIKVSGTIDPSLVDPLKLGALKKEYEIEKAIFLAPKCYIAVLKDDQKQICKIKGYTENLKFSEIEDLLVKDSFKVYTHEKFFKELALSSIRIKDTTYTLKITSFKRAAVFKNNILSHTLPLRIKDNEILTENIIEIG